MLKFECALVRRRGWETKGVGNELFLLPAAAPRDSTEPKECLEAFHQLGFRPQVHFLPIHLSLLIFIVITLGIH